MPVDRIEIPVALAAAIGPSRLPSGRWALAVSGGADSVALFRLVHAARPDIHPIVVHLNHQTRGDASDGDAAFVAELATRLGVTCETAQLAAVLPMLARMPANLSARYRAARHAWFAQCVRRHGLAGVLLAHHADDQAETIASRLARGSGPAGLAGMRALAGVGGLPIRRPLLGVRRAALRGWLRSISQPWREDASNASDAYERNRLRRRLAAEPELVDALLDVSKACDRLNRWSADIAGDRVPERLTVAGMDGLPRLMRARIAREWLIAVGVPAALIEPGVVQRLLAMLDDEATPREQTFPGGRRVRRTRGEIYLAPGMSGAKWQPVNVAGLPIAASPPCSRG